MDVYEGALQRQGSGEAIRPPLVSFCRNDNNGIFTRRGRTREVSSRYRSPTPSAPRRCPSPASARPHSSTSTSSLPKRSQSAERKRCSPSPPVSPRTPSTPVRDSCIEMQLSSRRPSTGRLPESCLWPATMRSLSVSFQSDTISIPVGKREKPVAAALSDRTLKPSSNLANKQIETPALPRKITPERKRSPLRGKNAGDLSENYKPVDGLKPRLVDQHRWPSRVGGKITSSTSLTRSVDLSDRILRISTSPSPGISISSLSKPLKISSSDASRVASSEDNYSQVFRLKKLTGSGSSERMALTNPAERSQSLPTLGSRPPSPCKASVLPTSFSRGMISPSRTRPSNAAVSRGVSPSQPRPSSPSHQPTNTTSVLSFVADIRKGKKGVTHIEDAHQLKLLYNRYLQWRFANAQVDDALYVQKVVSETTFCNVWGSLLALWDSVMSKRITLQQMRLKLKLDLVLNDQMSCLDDWALVERDHLSALCGVIEDLQASTLRLPLATGTRADIRAVKVVVCSAVNLMLEIGTSISSFLSRVEETNCAVSELAVLAAQGRSLLHECEAILASTAAMQVEEYSLKTHLIQALREG